MRGFTFAAALFLVALAVALPGRAGDSAQITANKDLPYPAEVALIDEPTGWTYRQNPTRLSLYFSDADPPGTSTCTGVCNWRWYPLFAPADAKPVGDWTLIARDDGKKQWAFKHRALYTHVHDSPDAPLGSDVAGWHVMPRFPQPTVATSTH